MATPQQQACKLWRQVAEKAWADPEYKRLLKKDPRGTLQKEIAAAHLDIELPKNIKIVEDTEKVANFVLPVEGIWIC